MSINNGKEERKTFDFLGFTLRVDKIPAGCAIPFTIEIDKVRKISLKAAESIASEADNVDQINDLTIKYFMEPEHLQEAHELMLQTIKAISVFTEYITDGELTEKHILMNADQEEVNELMIVIQEAINAPLKKHLENLKKRVVQ
ncbi:hypothetical protein DRQ25_09130 [Candidatus Fermentibacteria bacterium]|nr:MAG: hypothetical protein DRQ25_09130 [Candidatus Fermentibacteria bacterium]